MGYLWDNTRILMDIPSGYVKIAFEAMAQSK